MEIQRRILQNEAVMRSICSDVRDWLHTMDGPKVEIAVHCKRGRHRSVGLACILQRILPYSTRVRHISLERHPNLVCPCVRFACVLCVQCLLGWQTSSDQPPPALASSRPDRSQP